MSQSMLEQALAGADTPKLGDIPLGVYHMVITSVDKPNRSKKDNYGALFEAIIVEPQEMPDAKTGRIVTVYGSKVRGYCSLDINPALRFPDLSAVLRRLVALGYKEHLAEKEAEYASQGKDFTSDAQWLKGIRFQAAVEGKPRFKLRPLTQEQIDKGMKADEAEPLLMNGEKIQTGFDSGFIAWDQIAQSVSTENPPPF